MVRRVGLALALCCIAVSQSSEAMNGSYRREGHRNEYRIKPKDELDIRIEGACIYSTHFEVDGRGLIDVPFAGEVRAAGRTVDELASVLARALGKYVKDPKVRVRVIERRA